MSVLGPASDDPASSPKGDEVGELVGRGGSSEVVVIEI